MLSPNPMVVADILISWIAEWATEINAIVSIFLTGAILWVYLQQRDIMDKQTEIQADQSGLLSEQTQIQSNQTDIMQSQTELMQSEHEAREKPLIEVLDLEAHPQNKITFSGSNFGNGVASNLRVRSELKVSDDEIETFFDSAPVKYTDSREPYNSSLYPGEKNQELVSHVVCGLDNQRSPGRHSQGLNAAIVEICQVLAQDEVEVRLVVEVVYEDILGNTYSEDLVDTGQTFVSSGMGVQDII
ncbi:hypothetical protein DVK00_05060 [Haloarcula sp. Atlit-47R]|nr:hypothetical protein DVK00_05060 [Haloarcula sp. Atlit-47R]